MRGTRELVGSYNLGSMANAMPQALGAQALHRDRQVIAFCGDGGLTMLLGDIITAVTHELPVRLVVFNNGRLGMVKLEQEQAGLPEFGTKLSDVNLAAIASAAGLHAMRVEQPSELDDAIALGVRPPRPGAARRRDQPRGDLAAAQDQARARRGGSRSPSSPRRSRAARS